MKVSNTLLGGLSEREFLRDYWQKKPLLVRQALPQFTGLLDPQELLVLACEQDIQARLLTQYRGRWQLQHGPFEPQDFTGLPKTRWTALVQGVNHYLPEAARLLKKFSFIPHTRLDDLMVSYAVKGGGVGPHFDSYDVFLLQGSGHRRWQISAQQDYRLVEHAPMKILRNFTAEQEWVLGPGDMLYLPPHYAHNGVAEDDCMTYSIGFRAPAYQELAEQFLVYLQDRVMITGRYADPDLQVPRHPGEISRAMLHQVSQAIRQVRWDQRTIADFLGCYLSEPKPHIFFVAPHKPLSRIRFDAALRANGISLDLKTQMLCHDNTVFINGIAHAVSAQAYPALLTLADTRELDAAEYLPEILALLYQCYADGYFNIIRSGVSHER
jgi:50S ribosomal protein L16 3-hydroxylase